MSLRRRDRMALAVIGCLVAVAAYYMLALKPEQKKATSLAASVASEQQTLTSAEQSFAAGRAAQLSLAKQNAEWSALRLAVPSQSNIPGLLRTLDHDANSIGVKLYSISLANASPGGSAAPTSSTTTASSEATGIPVQMTFNGGYVALNKLVSRIDGMVKLSRNGVSASGPLMSISQVELSGSAGLTVTLSADIYQLAAASSSTTTAGG